MIVKDLDTLGYHRVVFRCDNEPSILALLRAVKLAWTGDVVHETSAEGKPQSNGAAESSVNVVKGHVRSIKQAVESASSVEVPADHDLLTWFVPYATIMHRRFVVGRDGKTAHERNVGRRAVPPLAQFGERVWWMPLLPSNRRLSPLGSRFEQGRYLGPMDGSSTVLIGTASGVVKARTIKRLPPGERWTGSLLDEALCSELTPNTLEDDGGRVGIRAPVLKNMRQFLYLHWLLKFDKYDERHCAEMTLNSLDTLTIALDVPTQEQVVNRRWIIQNNAVPAWKQSCRRPPKVTKHWSEHAIVLFRLPRNQRMKHPSTRDIALSAKGEQPLASPGEGCRSSCSSCHLRHRLRHLHLNSRHLQDGVWNRKPK